MDRRELTRREIEIVKLVAIGLTNLEIAEDLEASMATVKRHIANVMLKWNVQNRTKVAVEAIRRGMVPRDAL
jgi:DNA-binding NarL/FixJ family response regulator